MLMTRALLAAAQSIPLRMLKVVLCALSPSPVKARTAEQPHLRRNADQFAVGGDGAGHAGAVRMRRRRRAERVVFARDHAGEIGMAGVDLGIDHRHQHVVAIADAVRVQQMQLGNDILRAAPRLAAGAGRACCKT